MVVLADTEEQKAALLNILSSVIGSLTNPNKLKNTFKSVGNSRITATTITKYIEYLEDAFLVESAKRYDIKGKSYIGTPFKYCILISIGTLILIFFAEVCKRL